jgi:aryl-alcohol dehydrogenase-like predicted oxidoreductase
MADSLPRVPKRRLGRTNLYIPVTPYGSAGFGDAFGVVPEAEAVALMTRAFELGVNHLDTSPCYGTSLPKVGAFLADMPRQQMIVSSRVCCHGESPAYTADAALQAVEYNLETLRTDYLDIALIHDPGDIAPVIAQGGTLDGLLRAKEQGLVRFIGIGTRPHYQHLAMIATGALDMLLTFNDYNLLRQSAAYRVLPACRANDIGVLNGWSIVRGILTGRDVEEAAREGHWNLESPDIPRAKAIREWCHREGVSMLALTLQFCLREERIHGHPQGWRTKEQLEAAVRAVTEPLPPEMWDRFAAQEF